MVICYLLVIFLATSYHLTTDPNCQVWDSVNNVCKQCKPTYFQSLDNTTCYLCTPSNCISCINSGTNTANCTGCIDPKMSAPNCACQSQYVISIDSMSCIACPSNCLTCVNNNNVPQCTVCNSQSNLDPASNCKSCLNGFRMQQTGVCTPCPIGCTSCYSSATDSPICSYCVDRLMIVNSVGMCICPSQFYFLSSNGLSCMACSSISACASCINNGNNAPVCSQCINRYNLVGGNCVCPAGSYVSGTLCLPCPSNCNACSLTQGNVVCSGCVDPNMDNTQNCQCKTGFYQSLVTTTCVACTSQPSTQACSTCYNIGEFPFCTACVGANIVPLNGKCICSKGYYLSPVDNKTCSVCPQNCQVCTSNNGNAVCSTCIADINMQLVNGVCTCAKGFYFGTTSCLSCPSSCSSCQSATSCQTCKDTANMNGPLCSCNTTSMVSLDGSHCIPCSTILGCIQCVNNNTQNGYCTQCVLNPSIIKVNGACTCSGSNYLNGTDCVSCVPPTQTQVCNTCIYSPSTGVQCTSCADQVNMMTFNNTCICVPGMYVNSAAQCNPCPPMCTTCNSMTDCTIVVNGLTVSDCYFDPYVDTTTLNCQCKTGYYVYGYNHHCAACPTSCTSCHFINYLAFNVVCDTCYDLKMDPNRNCTCVDGYYLSLNMKNCLPCSTGCNTCRNKNITTDASTCASCISGFKPSGDICICVDSTMFISGIGSCISCSTYNTLCQTCSYTISYNLNNPIQMCTSCNTIQDATNSSCQCPICTKCAANSSPYQGICICNPGYVLNSVTKICNKCPPNCVTCTSSTQCTACIESSMILASTGCSCKTGFYLNTVTPAAPFCNFCPIGCNTCQSPTNCCADTTCCSDTTNSVNLNGVCTCKPNFAMYMGDGMCYACPTCVAGSYCMLPYTSTPQPLGSTLTLVCVAFASAPPANTVYDPANQANFKCQYGYVGDLASNPTKCVKCPSACMNTCFYSNGQSTCTGVSQGQCTDPSQPANCGGCSPSYFTDNNQVTCELCTSHNTSSSHCTSCVNLLNMNYPLCNACNIGANTAFYDATSCTCNDGYYLDSNTAACLACPTGCALCSSSTSCTSCTSLAMTITNGVCQCDPAHYPSGKDCVICGSGCATCNPTTCLTCIDINNMTISTTSPGTCVCNCTKCSMSLDGKACLPFPRSCTSVTFNVLNEPTCTVCTDTTNMYIDTYGMCTCNSAFFLPENESICQTCTSVSNPYCTKCQLQSHSNIVCQQCGNGTVLNYADHSCSCASMQGFSAFAKQCMPCNTIPNNNVCLTCTFDANGNVNSCGTCIDSVNMISGISLCSCKQGMYWSSVACVSCASSCASCINGTSCNSCKDPTTQIGTQCSCATGYFMYQDGSTCGKCGVLCSTCIPSGPTTSACTICASNAILNTATGVCTCAAGFFQDTVNNVCSPCASGCTTCISQTNCTTCTTLPFLTNLNFVCTCNPGYYMQVNNGTVSCLVCPAGCKTCTSGTACTSCYDNNMVLANQCKCNTGYAISNDATTCIACPITCPNSCANNGLNTAICTLCPDANAQLVNSACECNPGYYYTATTSATCTSCPAPCGSCVMGLASVVCITCSDIHMSIQGTTCVCISEYYLNGTVCSACGNLCSLCTSATLCSQCENPVTMKLSNSVCICADGYYLNSFGTNCITCPTQCKTCSLVSGQVVCQTCQDANMNPAQLCACNYGFFLSLTNINCLTCPKYCSCYNDGHNNGICGSCSDPINMFINTNGQCICKDGTYLTGTTCTTCPINCATCLSATNCLTCKANNMIANMVCACPLSYYSRTDGTACILCPLNCPSCVNKGDPNNSPVCNSPCPDPNAQVVGGACVCNTGYFLSVDQKTCKPCGTACNSCNGGAGDISVCIKCNDIVNMKLSGPNCICPATFYMSMDLTKCFTCPAICPNCSNNKVDMPSCNTCIAANMILTLGTCSCPTGTFLANSQITCITCPIACPTCKNDGNNNPICTSCTDPYMNVSANCPCLPAYYLLTNQINCMYCPTGCTLCINSGTNTSICTKCSNVDMVITNGLCVCMNTYFLSSDMLNCLPCIANCPTCINSGTGNVSTCTSCSDPKMSIVNGLCVCPSGTFNTLDTLKCVVCGSLCTACTDYNNNSYCTTCVTNAAPNKGICSCNSGYFADPTNSYCTKCPPTCLTCHGDVNGKPICDSCQDATHMTVVNNICACSAGTYLYNDSTYCVPCPSTCSICNNNGTNSPICTACQDPTKMRINNGMCICPSGTFVKNDSTTCLSCPNTCLTCHNDAANNPICDSCTDQSNMIFVLNICTCPAAYYVTSLYQCKKCYPQCPQCKANTDDTPYCTACIEADMLLNNGVCTCPNGKFIATTMDSCISCSYDCAICINNGQNGGFCTQCKDSNMMIIKGLCNCLPHYYEFINPIPPTFCGICPFTCVTCQNNGADLPFCLTCKDPHMLTAENCICGGQYYVINQTVCHECPNLCASCHAAPTSDVGYCFDINSGAATCLDPNKMHLDPASNLCFCNDGYYYYNNDCLNCLAPCKACNGNATLCISCMDPNMDTSKVCECFVGFYRTADNSRCVLCSNISPGCKSCQLQGGAPVCLSCVDPTMLIQNSQCVCRFPNYYFNKTNSACQKCDARCATCKGPTNANCITCSTIPNINPALQNNNTCICKDKYTFSNDKCSNSSRMIYIIAGILILLVVIVLILVVVLCRK